ncbi:MAG: hypothetical protein GY811_18775 [Myxococcales bacterium]|nr:hypothetical protein [Myxococcales bacterium]
MSKGAVYQAGLWQDRVAKKRVPQAAEIKKRAAAFEGSVTPVVPGNDGLLLERSFSIGLGYSSIKGLIFELSISVTPWFILPATEVR